MKKNLLLLISLCGCYFNVFAQDHGITIYTDEDLNPILMFSNARDQNYTMGFGFGYTSKCMEHSWVFSPNEFIMKKLTGRYVFKESVQRMPVSLTLNGTAFTPDDLRSYNVIRDDRPYAFLLSLSTKEFFLNTANNEYYTSEFDYGVLGLGLGAFVQTSIHKTMNDGDTHEPFIPRGWPHQISNGGEPTFLYSLTYEKLLTPASMSNQWYELKWGWQGMAGYYAGGGAQLAGRVGILDSRNWIQSFNPLGHGNKGGHLTGGSKNKFELFLFGSLRPTVMLYNELLSGGFRHSDHTLDFNRTNHFILEWDSGIGINIPSCKSSVFSLAWALNSGRTSEINTPLRRSHQWGGIYLTYSY